MKAKTIQQNDIRYTPVVISFIISVAIGTGGVVMLPKITTHEMVFRVLIPLIRLIFFIGLGLAVGQFIEAMGWIRYLSFLANPIFNYSNLGSLCSASFTTAFFSGVGSNAMLLNFYKDNKITKKQLYLTNFINQLPAFFLHLPTTFFIVVPLTRWAGVLYFILTFAAAVLRTLAFMIYGHFRLPKPLPDNQESPLPTSVKHEKQLKTIFSGIKQKLPSRLINVVTYVVPIYILIYFVNAVGFFEYAQKWLATYITSSILPVEAVSIVILSFVAEFTSGFASAGALLDAGVLTTQQTVLALLIGNIIAFPIRTLRHQLPRYMGIFSPKMGAEMLLLGQGFRVVSLMVIGLIYYFVG